VSESTMLLNLCHKELYTNAYASREEGISHHTK
jgi:hypothetical protein